MATGSAPFSNCNQRPDRTDLGHRIGDLVMSNEKYTNDGQQRVLALIKVLAGHEMVGLSMKDIGAAQKCSLQLVLRDLANLEQAGFAERLTETGRWRLAPAMVQIAVAFSASINRARRRLDETEQRYTRSTY